MFLQKTKSNDIDAFISKTSIDSFISHSEFILVNNVLREYDDTKEETNKLKDFNSSSKILIYS